MAMARLISPLPPSSFPGWARFFPVTATDTLRFDAATHQSRFAAVSRPATRKVSSDHRLGIRDDIIRVRTVKFRRVGVTSMRVQTISQSN